MLRLVLILAVLCYTYRPLSYIQYIDQQMHTIKYNKLQIINTIRDMNQPYMFPLQTATNTWSAGLVIFCVHRLPQDGTAVQKHVVGDTYHELCFMSCNLLYFITCTGWSIY